MRTLFFLALLFATTITHGQNGAYPPPTLREVIMQPDENTRPVLGLFKNETQAATWLTVGGLASMTAGTFLQGRAARHIQVHGHSADGDNYEITRTTGLSMQVLGAAAYGAGFTYRSKKWYKKRPVLFGALETVALFGLNHYIAKTGYASVLW
jgi:hypothetical protein